MGGGGYFSGGIGSTESWYRDYYYNSFMIQLSYCIDSLSIYSVYIFYFPTLYMATSPTIILFFFFFYKLNYKLPCMYILKYTKPYGKKEKKKKKKKKRVYMIYIYIY